MAKGMDKMIAEMRQQAEELTIALRVFDRMNGGNGKAMNNVKAAMGMIKGRAKKNGAEPAEGEPVQVIEGLRELSMMDAIKTALRAVNRPVEPKEVAQLLVAAGRDDADKMSQKLANLAARPHLHHVKRTKKGYIITA